MTVPKTFIKEKSAKSVFLEQQNRKSAPDPYRIWIIVWVFIFLLLTCAILLSNFIFCQQITGEGTEIGYNSTEEVNLTDTINTESTMKTEEYETVELKFLSRVNPSILHLSDYHVILIEHYVKNEIYILHLKKPNGMFLVENMSFHEEIDCVYSGKIVSQSGGYIGMAALSSCQHEMAFEGLISLNETHYQVTPLNNSDLMNSHQHNIRKRSNKKGSKHVVNHKLTKAKTSPSTAYRRKDTKLLSEKERKKAYDQMLKDQEGLDDETGEDDEGSSNSTDTNDPETLSYGADLDFDETNNKNNLEETQFVAQRKVIRKPTKASKAATKVIELAIFTDETFYKKWAAEYPKDTVKHINQYILALVNNMNYLYAQPSMKEKITFRLVHYQIMKSTPSDLKTSQYADNYLDYFCAFAGKKDTNGHIWDHAMLITGYDLLDDRGTTGNLGIAFTSTMCLRYYSCSLIEYVKGFETAFTATHEVGHSLGMLHDGDSFNQNCDEAKYMMAALSGKGQIYWSDCSNKNIHQFFATGDPDPGVKNKKQVPQCLMKKGSRRKSIPYKRGKFPGQIFNPKEQCDQACDGCVPYITDQYPYNNYCWMLHCKNPSGDIIDAHPALEGTNCGKNKRCRIGKCQ